MGVGGGDGDDLASEFFDVSREVNFAETSAVAVEEVGVFGGGAFDEDFIGFTDAGGVFAECDFFLEGNQFVEAVFADLGGDLIHFGGGGSGAWGVSEHIGSIELEALHAGESAFEFFFGFAGKADDDVGGEADIRHFFAEFGDDGGE